MLIRSSLPRSLAVRGAAHQPCSSAWPPHSTEPIDAGYAARKTLSDLLQLLQQARRFYEACHQADRANRKRRLVWKEPVPFFFRNATTSTSRSPQPYREPNAIDRHGPAVRSHHPQSAEAWYALPEAVESAIALLCRSIEARRVARILPGLRPTLAKLPPQMPEVSRLLKVLEVLDDAVVLVLHPSQRRGFRVLVQGVASLDQFQTLLTAAIVGDPAQGWLAGPRPAPALVAVAGGEDAHVASQPLIDTASFQMLTYEAIAADGSIRNGLAGLSAWLGGDASPRSIPLVENLRVVVLTEPPLVRSWVVEAPFPQLRAEVRCLEVLSPSQTDAWRTRLAQEVNDSTSSRR